MPRLAARGRVRHQTLMRQHSSQSFFQQRLSACDTRLLITLTPTMKIPKLRWLIAAMLFLATMINYTDRLALSVVSRDVRTEFGMSEQDYSYVVTIFLVAYAIMYAGSGYVVDRLGTRKGFAFFITLWSAGAM